MLTIPFLLLALPPQTASILAQPVEHQALGGVDVPLARMPNVEHVGNTAGAAFLDYDGDGWIDLYVNYTGRLWRNINGTTFTQVADLDAFLPPRADRYGASCGDFDNDGLPDIACEPRGDCFYLLRNKGTGNFLEIASDPALVIDLPGCGMYAETFCWADLDEDGDLDLWAPAYPPSVEPTSEGNQFFENLGPTGPGGAYRLANRTLASGLAIPDGNGGPEGAQFVDADRDGDLDAFANGTLYQNVTATSGPRFNQLVRMPTGITLASRGDEGIVFFDYDLDGDQDLLVVYKGFGNRIWENEGDGTFQDAAGVFERPGDGSTLGCSAEDWDLDGDLDVTTGHIFRLNLLVESGQRYMRVASHSLESYLDFPTPAWGDWDKDGDVDCMLANWRGRGRFLRNYTYGAVTPALDKLSLRVRPVNDSPLVARGLETEFGATVEVRVHGDTSGFVRRRFVASSHGYLQQSEYALTFALPPGPDPDQPARGVRFDLLVDFPSLPANGILRVDKSVNPALGALALEALAQREITVFRSGLVRIDGMDYSPRATFSRRLASSGALVLPRVGAALAEPVPAPADQWLVGMELDTAPASGALRVAELVLDGQLAGAGAGRCGANVLLYDVTAGGPALLVEQAELATSPHNDRSFLALDWNLKPQRVYRVLCRVTELRPSPRLAPAGAAALVNRGALAFADPNPCDPALLTSAPVDAATSYFELRYRTSAPVRGGGNLR